MANKRMISLNIVNSARFLRLPIDSQNLYFHLVVRADDDGIVEAYTVIKLLGSNEDNLKILHTKEFIKVLNVDLVSYITDWNMHNTLRSDRKVDSIYKDLLIQIMPDIKLLEPVPRSDVKNNSRRINGQSTDSPRSAEDSIDQYSIDQLNKTIGDQVTERLNSYTSDEQLLFALNKFVEHRKMMKKPIKTLYTLNLILKELDKHQDKLSVVNQSIANGWQGLFELKKKSGQIVKPTNRTNFDQREYTEEELSDFYITASNKYKPKGG